MSESDGQQRKKEDYQSLFATQEGQRVLADLMANFNMGRSSHVPGDPYETAFREGERHVDLHILNLAGERSDPQWLNGKLDQGEVEYSVIQEFS